MSNLEGVILGIGNPLLDISADVPQQFLDKYGVKVNDAILAEDKHMPIYQDLVDNFSVKFTAGGATQNTIRLCQWFSPPKTTSYIGCVGKDQNAEILKSAAEADGVAVHYLQDSSHPTGRCAVLIHDTERSLITDLAAANHYKAEHLSTSEINDLVNKAKYFYSAGFFLTVSPESLMKLAKHVQQHQDKYLLGNISAPFIAMFFSDPLLAAVPYYDYLFGNESEAEALGKKLGLTDLSISNIAIHLANIPHITETRHRHVIFTQGSKETIVAVGGKEGIQRFPVPLLDKSLIVDLNGAGDAFVGGFLSQLIQGSDLQRCIDVGHYAARTIIQVSGIVLKGKPEI